MKTQNVTSRYVSNNKIKNDLAFKSKLTFDIGASDPKRGSLKILVQDNNGKDLFIYKGFVNNSAEGFKDNDHFISQVAHATNVEELINEDIKSLKIQMADSTLSENAVKKLNEKVETLQNNKLILQNRSKSERILTGFALLLPGTLQQKTALFMANLKKTDGTSLEDVNLEKIIDEIRNQGKVKLAKNFNSSKDFIPCKDLAGTGIGIAKKILNHPEYGKRFDKGFYGVAVQTGGGFGAVDIKVKDDKFVEIETNEGGHDLVYDPVTGTQKRLGKLGASTSSVIENYAKKLGITGFSDIKALTDTGKAEMSTQKNLKLDTDKNSNAIDILLKTGAYETVTHNSETTTLRVKDLETFAKASTAAISSYADAIASHAITRINRGANLYVLSGPLAMGLNDRIKESPELFGEGIKDMRDLIFSKIDKLVGNDFTCNKLRDKNHFDIVCTKEMSIADNTSGGSLLLARKTSNFARRGEWITISTEVLKDKISTIKILKTKMSELSTNILKYLQKLK